MLAEHPNSCAFRLTRRIWRITGQVQGVGFRPFIWRVANDNRIIGSVRNDSRGVVIDAQATELQLDAFLSDLLAKKPRFAQISSVSCSTVNDLVATDGFLIESSRDDDLPGADVTVDLAVCPQCLAEMCDRSDRRHRYPLINCTECGPRYSIVRRVPYDRPNTTMAGFPLCPECRDEYENPADRRFHAQPVACPTCGPTPRLLTSTGEPVPGDPIAGAVRRLLDGQTVAIKGIGGFHLAVRADDEAAVRRLRERKHRSHKPFAILCPSGAVAQTLVKFGTNSEPLLSSAAAPIVLAPRLPDAPVAPAVAPDQHRLGVMLAYTPLQHLLFDHSEGALPPLVMTSGNDSAEPLVWRDEDVVAHLGPLCDAILTHDRPIARPVDDSVLIDAADGPLPVRRARGFVPSPIHLPFASEEHGLCVGGEQKVTVAVVRGEQVILSQHLGDLTHSSTFASFQKAIDDLCELFGVHPRWIAHDLHPAYLSTTYAKQLARKLGARLVPVQHHHAHAAAVLAEHGHTGAALAVVCDGTGYGTDATVWGGELLAVSAPSPLARLAHLATFRLPGGDAAARHPWRSALALLHAVFGDRFASLPLCQRLCSPQQLAFVCSMLRTNANCATTSSTGRLFDGVAALLGLCRDNQFEAQAAMRLETIAAEHGPIEIAAPLFELNGNGVTRIDLFPFVRHLVERIGRDAPGYLAALFHAQLAAAWEAAVVRAAQTTGIRTVALSGGVFCNEILSAALSARLTATGLTVLRHRQVPPNDGGLSLGQAAIAGREKRLLIE